MLEARLEGRKPVAVTHRAATTGQAVSGAAGKLARMLDSAFGKERRQRNRSGGHFPQKQETPDQP